MNIHNSDSLYSTFSQVLRFHYYRTHSLLEKVGVYPGQPPLLFALGKQDGQSQKELAEKLHIKAATITVMLNRMEKADLVKRRQNSLDQRVTRVFLTEHGKKVQSEVIEALKIIEEELFKNFTDEEKIILRRLLMQMHNNLSNACEKSK